MKKVEADLCIVGAGSGGLSLAAGAAQLGKKVVLIERGEMGGDCLNYGCVPSKALLAAAAAAQSQRDGGKFGVVAHEPQIDFGAVMDHVQSVIGAIAPHDSQGRFEGFGVHVIRAHGSFSGPRTVVAGDHEVTAKFIVLATGSSPFVPPIPGIDATPYFTNETIFQNRQRPDHLIVIGGGPIGVELAQAHRRLGSAVTVVEGLTILNRDDPEAVAIVRQRLVSEGVVILENTKVAALSQKAASVSVSLSDGSTIEGSHLLFAVGRKAHTEGLNLEAANVEFDAKGVKTTEGLRTTNKRVFAMGDVAGGLQFTHVAGDHASTLVRSLLFKSPFARRRDAIAPKVTYCDPEIASVGLTETEALAAHPDARIVRWSFGENDRAQAERRTEGFIKAFIGKKGVILGAAIVGKGAGDAITLWAFAMANRLPIIAFTKFIAPYPTRAEISKRAGSAFYTPTLFSDRTRAIVKMLGSFD